MITVAFSYDNFQISHSRLQQVDPVRSGPVAGHTGAEQATLQNNLVATAFGVVFAADPEFFDGLSNNTVTPRHRIRL
ncbi:MAG: hypothetical protein O2971_04535 [Proteobacteria bacterium]|nr:hypothetical protein [Pseudomonadota bacterium]